jgi:hypothetical protein
MNSQSWFTSLDPLPAKEPRRQTTAQWHATKSKSFGLERRQRADSRIIALPSFRFSGVLSSQSTYLEKTPTAQFTRIDAADGLFFVPLTCITSVPECAVSSVGFLWGSAAVPLSCGVSVGLAEAPDWPGRPGAGYSSPAGFRILMITFRLTQCHRSGLPGCGNSAPAGYLLGPAVRTGVPTPRTASYGHQVACCGHVHSQVSPGVVA